MAESPDPDAELMLRVQRGDLAAFEQLIERYKQPVANLIHRTLGDATEATRIGVAITRSLHSGQVETVV